MTCPKCQQEDVSLTGRGKLYRHGAGYATQRGDFSCPASWTFPNEWKGYREALKTLAVKS